MKTRNFLVGAAGLVLLTAAALAAPANITSGRRADCYAPGRHQFYVWCTNGKDRVAYQQGASGADALAKLRLAEAGCQPVWQGRVGS